MMDFFRGKTEHFSEYVYVLKIKFKIREVIYVPPQ